MSPTLPLPPVSTDSGEGVQYCGVTQADPAPLAPSPPSVGVGQSGRVTQTRAATSDVSLSVAIATLVQLHRSRLTFVSAKVKIELQIKAIQRQVHAQAGCPKATHATCPGVYKTTTPDIERLREVALDPLETEAEMRLKAMLAEAKALPARALAFADETRGFGRPSLAQIVAEAGDLSHYANPAKLWSRMGLGLSPEHSSRYEGRSPRRRAIMAVIGGNFLKVKGGCPYRDLYDQRKAFEQTKPACMKPLKNKKGDPIGVCKDPDAECCRAGHVHNRTLRYVEKRLLRELWRAWNAA